MDNIGENHSTKAEGSLGAITTIMFTYIFYFRGGVYISQVQCNNLKESMIKWAENIIIDDVKYFGEKMKLELCDQVKLEHPTPIKNIYNVWYADFLLFGVYAFVHIIKMDNVPEVLINAVI